MSEPVLRNSILKLQARLNEIDIILSRPPMPRLVVSQWGGSGMVKPTKRSRIQLHEERLHLQKEIKELGTALRLQQYHAATGPSARTAIAQELAERGTPLRKGMPSSSIDPQLAAAEKNLAAFRSEFGRHLRDIRDKHKAETVNRLKKCFETFFDLDDLFKNRQELLRSGIFAWRNSLAELVTREVRTLAEIAANNSRSHSEPGEEVDWACLEVEQLLEKGLGQEISIESSLDDWRPATVSNQRLSAVENWSRWVCGGEAEFDIKPWTAPAWYDLGIRPKIWTASGRPERINAEMTTRATRRYQMLLVENIEADLERAKDQARIELARRDSLVRPDKSQPQSKIPGQVSTQSTVPLKVADLIPDKLPAKKSDLSQYLDSSGLTERQHECASLHFEYGLSKLEIGRRLGIHRKGVSDHIAAAGRRIDLARAGLKRTRLKAKSTEI